MASGSLIRHEFTTGSRFGRVVPGLLVGGFGCVLFIAGWALAFSGFGQYLLLSGLAFCLVGGWLFGGWRSALLAPLLAVGLGIAALVVVNVTAAAWHQFRDSDAPAIQTPSPKR